MLAKAAAAAMRPDPYILMSDWAERNFILPRESSKEHGRYRIERTPFVKEILDELSPQSPTQEVVLVKPTQLAGTTIGIIFLMCIADLYPGPTLFITVTESLAKRFSKKRITPSVRLMSNLRGKIKEHKTRDSGNTILVKEFPGGSWVLAGSNSAASYRSEPAKYIILDDFDGFERDIEGEGDPGELADRRAGSFSDAKIYKNSTPTEKGNSLIEASYEETSQGEFHVPCPHCGYFQYLVFGSRDTKHGVKFTRHENGDIKDVWYSCEKCHKKIGEYQKQSMLPNGKYVHRYPDRLKKGFRYNALYSPIGWRNTWRKIAQDFLKAAGEIKLGNPQRMKTWTNTMMAEAWEEEGTQPQWENLATRVENYQEKWVPMRGLLLTAGVDVQDNRLIVGVFAWGRGEENWKIFYTELYGDPETDDVWENLDIILNADYEHESHNRLKILSVCVDTGGHRTQRVYNYCRTRFPLVTAIKGVPGAGKPVISATPTLVDVSFGGQKIKEGCQLWSVGDDTTKSTIYSRMNIVQSGPGCFHWNNGTPDEYFKQLTAEKIVTRQIKGFPVSEWVKTRSNDALDVNKYAYAAAIRAGMNYPGFWEEIEKFISNGNKPESDNEYEDNELDTKTKPRNDWFR